MSSMQDRAVIGNHHAIVASASHARHRRQLLARGRIPPNLRVEKRERPGEDVVGRRHIEPVLHAGQRDEFARPGEPRDALLRHDDRRCRIRRAADGEIRQRDAVEPMLVAPERRQERLPEIWHIAHRRLEARDRRLPGSSDTRATWSIRRRPSASLSRHPCSPRSLRSALHRRGRAIADARARGRARPTSTAVAMPAAR